MGLREWSHRRYERNLDKVIAKVDQHVPPASGVRIGDPPSMRCQKCKHVFDGTPEDLRRHHLAVAYRLGENGAVGFS